MDLKASCFKGMDYLKNKWKSLSKLSARHLRFSKNNELIPMWVKKFIYFLVKMLNYVLNSKLKGNGRER